MSLVLDHVVILVADLEAAIVDYVGLGFTVQRGGTHADGATHNALVGFADGSYLELIAFLRPAPEHRWWRHAQRGHEGFIDFALLPASVGAVIEAARSRGLAYEGPHEGGRVRLDGQRLVWQTGTPPAPELPFLCGDVTPRALRVVEGEVRVHANGTQGVASLSVLVTELDTSLARYAALLGPPSAPGARAVAMPGLGLRQATLDLGPTLLVLAEPGPDAKDSTALRGMLAGRGPGVLGLALRGPAAAPPRALSRQRTHGAALEIVAD